ncbi:probable glycosyltransferase At5g03795 isoform X1 [Malania oleifera]|uniref:probable glycosyltransferase At5g03795 isoform X1 n=1 Tax=Malania oleifera TaxID=397392 RepID=UPI0025AEB28A|nr:probable glycosyltransferase At5g03795 isoform X1 [Malania oleifera]
MEKNFKVYRYPDGDLNTYYQTRRKLTGNYASEEYFFQTIRDSRFRADDADQSHLFFIPISCHKMRAKIQKHFQWNSPPIRYDTFHMVMYDLWLHHHVIKY